MDRLNVPKSLGVISVPSPGTPVRVTTNTSLRATIVRFAGIIGHTGTVYVGVSGMNKFTSAGVIKQFWPTGASGGKADELVLFAPAGSAFRLSDFYVDANVVGEGVQVSYFEPEPEFNF